MPGLVLVQQACSEFDRAQAVDRGVVHFEQQREAVGRAWGAHCPRAGEEVDFPGGQGRVEGCGHQMGREPLQGVVVVGWVEVDVSAGVEGGVGHPAQAGGWVAAGGDFLPQERHPRCAFTQQPGRGLGGGRYVR